MGLEAAFRADRFLRRSRTLTLFVVLGLPVLGMVCGMLLPQLWGMSNFGAMAFFGFVGFNLVYGGLYILSARAMRRVIRDVMADNGYPICRKCGYDRAAVQAYAPCPECGTTPPAADSERAIAGGSLTWNESVLPEPIPRKPLDYRRRFVRWAVWFVGFEAAIGLIYLTTSPDSLTRSMLMLVTTIVFFTIWFLTRRKA